jgi:hypothetical protein
MFEKINFIENNPDKKNILITVSQLKTREYTYGYIYPLVEVLKEKYNVYYFYEGGKKDFSELGLENGYRLNKQLYCGFKDKYMKRKKELETSDQHNQALVDEAILKFFENEPHFDDIMIIDNHNLMLPFNPLSSHPKLRDLFNDYFDSFDDEPEIDVEIEKVNKKLFDITAKGFSPLAFRYMYKNIMLSVVEQLSKRDDATVHPIIIDPSAAIPFFSHKGIKHKFWYYTDDYRHRRDLTRFPFTELQHLVYEPHWKKITPNKKNLLEEFENPEEKVPFFFAGSLLNDKGLRKYIWQDFFKDFSYEGSKLYFKVSLIYGMDKDSFETLATEVKAHPNFCGDFMPNEEYMRLLKKCKTAFIARNVSANGGLTYRHIQYLYFGVLPVLDHLYDPDYLWFPKEFQDKITANSPERLREIVEYYDTHEKERLELLREMKKYYQVDEWVSNWRNMLKETKLFNEYLWK